MTKGSLSTGRESFYISTFWIFTSIYAVYGGTWKYSYHEEKTNWITAATICERENKHLLSFKSYEDFKQKIADSEIGEKVVVVPYRVSKVRQDERFRTEITEIGNCIYQTPKSNGDLWIGLKSKDNHCSSYVWHGLDPLGIWTNWDNGEPDNCLYQKCVRIRKTKLWRTTLCFATSRFICESFDDGKNTAVKSTIGAAKENSASESTSSTTNQNTVNGSSTVANNENVTLVSTTRKPEMDSTILENYLTSLGGENLTTMESTTTPDVIDDQSRNCSSICRDYASRNITNPCTEVSWSDNSNYSTSESLQEEIKKMQSKLRVVKNSTQLSIRRRISVYGSRTSAVVMGMAASIILAATCLFIMLLDLPNFIRFVRNIFL